MKYMAVPCGCGHRACTDWHVSMVANVQGVRFTRQQAELVAALLNDELDVRTLLPDNTVIDLRGLFK